jgi:histidinol phosphatase-like PHP family hydrolase
MPLMSEPELRLLVVTDLHYVKAAENGCTLPERRCALGRVLLRKTLLRLKHDGVKPDVLILLGDLVDNGAAAGAREDMAELAEEARQAGIPVLALPGNHDRGAGFAEHFDCAPGLHEIGGYGFLIFNDNFGPDDVTTRREEDLALPGRVAAERPDLPLVALQHNPLHPAIANAYPYLPVNTEAILRSYEEAGVVLSLSGHYHAGQPASRLGTVTYGAAPALCEDPFRFWEVTLRGREVAVRAHALKLPVAGLADVHCHSEYAYCASTVNARDDIALARALGLGRLCLTEHAFQLYFDRKEAWSFRWQSDEALVKRALESGGGRMPEYRRFAQSFRSDFVRLGLEVDLCSDGRLLLDPRDAAGWDVIVGAVHAIPGFKKGETAQAEAERLFMEATEKLLAQPIHVLAHPFRFFRVAGLLEPAHLRGWLLDRLVRRGVAAEINFHINENDPAFFRECVRRGVRIALGTDSHDLAQVAELHPHLEVLKRAGVSPDQFDRVLFRPG